MVTTKISIKRHLAEWLIAKYFDQAKGCIVIPDRLDLYHSIWDLMEKRPENCSRDEGNIILGLPDRRIGKDPEFYNYLGKRSVEIIQKRIEIMFFAEFRAMMDENKQKLGWTYLHTTYQFINKYSIEGITPDALYKDFYRWRKTVAGRMKITRNYEFKNKK